VANVKIRASRSFPQNPILRSLRATRVEPATSTQNENPIEFTESKNAQQYVIILWRKTITYTTQGKRAGHKTAGTRDTANTKTRTAGKKAQGTTTMFERRARWRSGSQCGHQRDECLHIFILYDIILLIKWIDKMNKICLVWSLNFS